LLPPQAALSVTKNQAKSVRVRVRSAPKVTSLPSIAAIVPEVGPKIQARDGRARESAYSPDLRLARVNYGKFRIGMRILLLRHAATAWTATGQHTGRTDLELSSAGVAEASATASLLAEVAGTDPLAAIYSSPLRRAVQTAELVLGTTAKFTLDEALAEFDYGRFEGLTPAQIQERAPGWSLWNDGCPGGESVEQATARVDAFIERARATHARETVVAVSHGHLLRLLAARLLGLPASEGRIFAIGTCSIADFREQGGRLQLAGWNRKR
jgi:probable phosphoglycerate mutase